MARISNENGVNIVPNPSSGKFINWMSPSEKNGITVPGFYYWQKGENDGEEGHNVAVPFPFTFQYLQDAVGIGGFLEKKNKFIFSNEVLDVYETPFDIQIWGEDKPEVLKSGFYYSEQKVPKSQMTEQEFKDLKLQIKKDGDNGTLQMITKLVTGAKKCKILYILLEGGEIARLKLEGGKLSAWENFQKAQNPNKWRNDDKNIKNFIVWSDIETVKNKNKDQKDYDVPVFTYEKATQEEIDNANNVYEELVKPYFDYLLAPKEENV